MVKDHTLQIPLISVYIGALWIAGFALIAARTLNPSRGYLGGWGIAMCLLATSLAAMQMHIQTRRMILEVMSFEHRQQTETLGGERMRLVD